MQKVSQNWKDNQKQVLVDESFVEVIYNISDFDASDHDTASSNNQEIFSKVEQISDGLEKEFTGYATLELHNWLLDGSRKHLPSDGNYENTGYVSDSMTNGYYVFENKPVIEINFSEIEKKVLPAITITWSKWFDEYATEFEVEYFQNTQKLAGHKIKSNEVVSVVPAEVKDYNRIVITIYRWCLPFHRARIEEVFIGLRNKYTKKDLFKLDQKQSVDLISGYAPQNAITFEVDNRDDRYGEDGLYRHILEKQRITVRYGYKFDGKMEWVDGGEYFLNKWEVPQGGITARFEGVSLIDFLSKTFYQGTFQRKNLYDLAVEVLQHADLPLLNGQVRWKIDDSLKTIYTDNPLPIVTGKECLQIIANAGRCVLYQDRKGFINIKPITFEKNETFPEYEVNDFNSFQNAKAGYIPTLKEVHSYYTTYFETENTEVYKSDVTVSGAQEYWLTYDRLAKNVSAAVSGATIIEQIYYAGACKLKLSGSGTANIVLTGTEMRVTSSRYTVIAGKEGEIQETRNPLISNVDLARFNGEWIKSCLINRKKLDMDWRYDPVADCTDRIKQSHKEKEYEVLLSELKMNYNGGFRATGKGVVLNAVE